MRGAGRDAGAVRRANRVVGPCEPEACSVGRFSEGLWSGGACPTGWCASVCSFGWVGVTSAGGCGPFEYPFGVLCDVPAGVVFQGVVAAAEVGEVAGFGASAVCPVGGVVDIAPLCRGAAAGESAVLVPCPQQPAHLFGGPVPVHAQHGPGGRVFPDHIPAGRVTCEVPGGSGVDRAVTGELGELGVQGRPVITRFGCSRPGRWPVATACRRAPGAEGRANSEGTGSGRASTGRHRTCGEDVCRGDDLHDRADLAQPGTRVRGCGRRCGTRLGTIVTGCGAAGVGVTAEEEIGEEVGTGLVT